MTENRLSDVLARIALDPAFAEHARVDPQAVADEYGLDAKAVATLESLSVTAAADGPTPLAERLSRSSLFFGGSLAAAGDVHDADAGSGEILCDGLSPADGQASGKSVDLPGIGVNDLGSPDAHDYYGPAGGHSLLDGGGKPRIIGPEGPADIIGPAGPRAGTAADGLREPGALDKDVLIPGGLEDRPGGPGQGIPGFDGPGGPGHGIPGFDGPGGPGQGIPGFDGPGGPGIDDSNGIPGGVGIDGEHVAIPNDTGLASGDHGAVVDQWKTPYEFADGTHTAVSSEFADGHRMTVEYGPHGEVVGQYDTDVFAHGHHDHSEHGSGAGGDSTGHQGTTTARPSSAEEGPKAPPPVTGGTSGGGTSGGGTSGGGTSGGGTSGGGTSGGGTSGGGTSGGGTSGGGTSGGGTTGDGSGPHADDPHAHGKAPVGDGEGGADPNRAPVGDGEGGDPNQSPAGDGEGSDGNAGTAPAAGHAAGSAAGGAVFVAPSGTEDPTGGAAAAQTGGEATPTG